MATQGLDAQELIRLGEGCPLTMVEPVMPTPLDRSTFTAPRLPLPGPNPMSVLHQAVPGTTVKGAFVPNVGIPNTSISSLQPVLPFGPAFHAAQSLEGERLEQDHGMASHWTPLVNHRLQLQLLLCSSAGLGFWYSRIPTVY